MPACVNKSVGISLIVCTRNRAHSLGRCLNAIALSERDPQTWELIVVDNGSTDTSCDLVQEFAAQVAFRVILVNESRPGLARARNAGVRVASGDILAFTDDDCYPCATFLDQVSIGLRQNDWGYLGGRILLYDPSDARVTIKESDIVEEIPPFTVIAAGVIHGACMAVRRDVLERIGGFDASLGPGTPFNCEDVDMVTRASLAGIRGGYCPGPTVYHHHGRKNGKDFQRIHHSYDHGRGAYRAKLLLTRGARLPDLGPWCHGVASLLRRRAFGTLIRETAGMFHYTAFAALNRIRPADAVRSAPLTR